MLVWTGNERQQLFYMDIHKYYVQLLTLAPRNRASSSSCFRGSSVVWKWSIWVVVVVVQYRVHAQHTLHSARKCLLLLRGAPLIH